MNGTSPVPNESLSVSDAKYNLTKMSMSKKHKEIALQVPNQDVPSPRECPFTADGGGALGDCRGAGLLQRRH